MRVHALPRAMRRAPVSLVLAAFLAIAADPASAQEPSASPSPAAPTAIAATTPAKAAENYYDRRASETLKQDKQLAASPAHPLALAHPGYDVVVCEAGCEDERGPEIVYMERASAPAIVDTAEMVPTSSEGAAGAPFIACLGGCYDTPKRYAAPAELARKMSQASIASTSRPR